MKYDYDLFVIGGGSGGIRAARWSAQLGAKVALCEGDRLGGTCVIRGCIPKKLMFHASDFFHQMQVARDYGWNFENLKLNWDRFNEVRNQEIKRLEGVYRKLLQNSKVDFILGKGSFKDKNSIEVNGKIYTAKYILIAVGGKPNKPNIKGAEHGITSDEIFSLKRKPESLITIGSGYISLEFASIFNGLGVNTKVLFRRDLILRGFDKDIRKFVQEEMTKKRVIFIPNRSPVELLKEHGKTKIIDDQGEGHIADQVLIAMGRIPNVKDLNLDMVGVPLDEKFQIIVDRNFETNHSGIFAIGDCTNTPYQLTPVAINEGMMVSEHLFSKRKQKILDYKNIPTAIFTQPSFATVGMREEDIKEPVEIFESNFKSLKLSLGSDTERVYMKLIVSKETRKVLGCHMVGEHAEEVIQGFAVALKKGIKKEEWDSTIGIHPSSAEEFVTMRNPRS